MYLINRAEGAGARENAMLSPPFGPNFPETDASRAHALEVWGTDISEPVDYTEFRLYDVTGHQIGKRRVMGY